jgi:hypothetical protein
MDGLYLGSVVTRIRFQTLEARNEYWEIAPSLSLSLSLSLSTG